MNAFIVSLILNTAPHFDISPETALAVSKVESNLNPNARGLLGEVGLFQVRPEYSKYTVEQLKIPAINVSEGLRILSEAKKRCKHRESKQFTICFNRGITGGAKVQDPANDKYYLEVVKKMNKIKEENRLAAFNQDITWNTTTLGMILDDISDFLNAV